MVMEKISCTDRLRNAELLHRIKGRNVVVLIQQIKKGLPDWSHLV
jgi:hypothetical protein